jgi:hypothetical protein
MRLATNSLATAALAFATPIRAFSLTRYNRHSRLTTLLYDTLDPNTNEEGGDGGDEESSNNSNNNNHNKNNPFDVESARQQLESIMLDNVDSSSTAAAGAASSSNQAVFSWKALFDSNDDILVLPPPPPLSTIERDRRVAELLLLGRLEDDTVSPEATAALWALWYSERGSTAQALLQQADRCLSDPSSWHECELILTGLIDEYGVYFVEPVNRLATLYFLQGKMNKSHTLCRVVLQVKPWHFGALAGIVQVCIGLGDKDGARKWAAQRLPSSIADGSSGGSSSSSKASRRRFLDAADDDDDDESSDGRPTNPRRAEWVERMVMNANELLQAAEQTTKQSFGKPEEYYNNNEPQSNEPPPAEQNDQDQSDDAWQ